MHVNFILTLCLSLTVYFVCSDGGTASSVTEPVDEDGEIDIMKKVPTKKCTTSDDCSCTGGIPVCYQGTCGCILTKFICFEHKHCGELCGGGVGICMINACKCYDLVEDTKLSDSISPWTREEDL